MTTSQSIVAVERSGDGAKIRLFRGVTLRSDYATGRFGLLIEGVDLKLRPFAYEIDFPHGSSAKSRRVADLRDTSFAVYETTMKIGGDASAFVFTVAGLGSATAIVPLGPAEHVLVVFELEDGISQDAFVRAYCGPSDGERAELRRHRRDRLYFGIALGMLAVAAAATIYYLL